MDRIVIRQRCVMRRMIRLIAVLLTVCLLIPTDGMAVEKREDERGWIDFILVCNEGMNNSGGNAGNTMMVVSLNPDTGKIRLLMMAWDTFIDYPGYDLPQKLDMPYRNNGPEETVKVFNANFGMDIQLFMSLNYLNLASMIDEYGGVTIDISMAERNALNAMVASKKEAIMAQVNMGLLTQMYADRLAEEYYLNEYGPGTKLKGLQAVGYGWLQYDSVYNCCLREVEVVASLFTSVGKTIREKAVLYTDEYGEPANPNGRRLINLDHLTDSDYNFFRSEMAPIFRMAYHNLSEDDIHDISLALARASYTGSRQGFDILDNLEYKVFPLEARDPYDSVAGAKGHLVDYAANKKAMEEFLFSEEMLPSEEE